MTARYCWGVIRPGARRGRLLSHPDTSL